ncbi:Copia protein, partial [Mucuna pruriens]
MAQEDLNIKWDGPMKFYSDNKSMISIAHNPVKHDRKKHIEMDRHFIKEKQGSGLICTPYVPSQGQLPAPTGHTAMSIGAVSPVHIEFGRAYTGNT